MNKPKKGLMYESSTSNANTNYDFVDYTTAPLAQDLPHTQQPQKDNIIKKI